MALRDRTVLILIKSAVSSLAELNIFVNIPEDVFSIRTLILFSLIELSPFCQDSSYVFGQNIFTKGSSKYFFHNSLRAFTLLFFEKDTET